MDDPLPLPPQTHGMEKTLVAAMEKILKSGKMIWQRVPARSGPMGKT